MEGAQAPLPESKAELRWTSSAMLQFVLEVGIEVFGELAWNDYTKKYTPERVKIPATQHEVWQIDRITGRVRQPSLKGAPSVSSHARPLDLFHLERPLTWFYPSKLQPVRIRTPQCRSIEADR